MTTCEITLMGTFGVRIEGREVSADAWRHRRGAELVKILTLAEGHRMHRERLMDLIWPELGPESGGANLRKAVHFARRALGSEDAVDTSTDLFALWPSADLSIDAADFEAAVDVALRSGDPSDCDRAADLWRGELLPEDRYASWAEEPRERLRLKYIEALKNSGQWKRVRDLDPSDEVACRALMQSALDAGDRRGAIRHFELLRERLRTDMGMAPDEASVLLYEKVLAKEGDQPPTPAERAQALIAWGLVHLNGGAMDEAERTALEAREIAIDASLGKEIGETSALLGIIANMSGRWRDMFRAEFEDSVRRSPEIAAFVFDAHLCLAEYSLTGSSGHEEIRGYARSLLRVAEEAGSTQGRALAELMLGEADLFSDRLESAERHLDASASLHEQALAASGRAIAIQRLAETAIARDDRSRADDLLSQGLQLARSSSLAPHLVIRMHAALVEAEADPEAAYLRVTTADGELATRNVCPPCSISFRVAATIASARARELEQARGRLTEAERVAGMWPGGPWHAALWEARGELRRAEGDADQAAALFKEAAVRFAEVGRPRDEARCLAR